PESATGSVIWRLMQRHRNQILFSVPANLPTASIAARLQAMACRYPWGRENSPAGQITFWYSEMMSSPLIKNISLYPKIECWHIYRHPVPTRGALAIVTNVGRGCGGRGSCDRRAQLKRTAKACGPDVAVLASIHPEATVSRGATEAKEPFSGESTL